MIKLKILKIKIIDKPMEIQTRLSNYNHFTVIRDIIDEQYPGNEFTQFLQEMNPVFKKIVFHTIFFQDFTNTKNQLKIYLKIKCHGYFKTLYKVMSFQLLKDILPHCTRRYNFLGHTFTIFILRYLHFLKIQIQEDMILNKFFFKSIYMINIFRHLNNFGEITSDSVNNVFSYYRGKN